MRITIANILILVNCGLKPDQTIEMHLYPIGGSVDFNPFSSVCKFECIVCLLVVARCWGDCTYQLRKKKDIGL